ncbi:unnamed protein product [Cladocopium goreaui]|uniref:Uncharacterized protein n=1 Tax=Cladocopium goreaui TaxID=2562237 RepID=A0A9P1BME1_9DINO|nr:unnamed protein product [Cladocopium goreaui]
MDLHEIHCLFKDSAHAGDRRRKSQLCIAGVSQIHNKQFGFKNGTALLGTLGPVARARVNQLWTDNPESAPSPSVRVAQRGVPGTKEMLQKLLEGLDPPPDTKIFVVDLTLNRWNEWGRCLWELQRDRLKSEGQGLDWKFVSYVMKGDDEATSGIDQAISWIEGRSFSEWWDDCPEAGPKTRSKSDFCEQKPTLDILVVSGGKLKIPTAVLDSLQGQGESLQMEVEQWNSNHDLKLLATITSQNTRAKEDDRTLCAPVFAEGDNHLNFKRLVSLESLTVMTQGEFEAHVVRLGCIRAMGCADLFVVAGDNFQLWLLNPAANEVTCDAFEIFGFNVASYTEKAAGIARAESKEAIPFLLERDTDLLCLPGPTGKSLFCTAELACFLAQKQGITELSIADHALTPLVEDGTGAPRPFRYKVTCQGKVTCFEPKPLAPSADLMDLRGSMFGAYYLRNFDKLPASSMCRTLWEVSMDHCTVRPLKPKFWLTCSVKIPPQTALKLG